MEFLAEVSIRRIQSANKSGKLLFPGHFLPSMYHTNFKHWWHPYDSYPVGHSCGNRRYFPNS